jgi:hypothetical protein
LAAAEIAGRIGDFARLLRDALRHRRRLARRRGAFASRNLREKPRVASARGQKLDSRQDRHGSVLDVLFLFDPAAARGQDPDAYFARAARRDP